MVGILIAAHGSFGEGIMKGVELISGKQDRVIILGLSHGDSIEEFVEKVSQSIIHLDNGDGVLVFVDLLGASPYNAAALSLKKVGNTKFRCIAGVNLPMILETLIARNSCSNLDDLTDKALKAGFSGIKELFQEMRKYNDNN